MSTHPEFRLPGFEVSPFAPPDEPGVYAVWVSHDPFKSDVVSNHLVYIGCSANIRRRVESSQHLYRRLYYRLTTGYVYVSWMKTLDYKEEEKYLIRKHRPLLNIQHKYGKALH